MDKTKKSLAFSFVMVLVAVTIVSVIGMILLDRKPVVLQGQIEATEIRISGKLPGRIDRFLVEEGERVAAGDHPASGMSLGFVEYHVGDYAVAHQDHKHRPE